MSENPPPPPPPGGTPPPPPPPPEGGWGAPPPSPAGAWDVAACLSYSWKKFNENMAQIVLAAVGLIVAIAIVYGLGFLVVGALTSWDTPFLVSLFLYSVLYGAVFVVAQLLAAAIIRGALAITEGREFWAADAFKFEQIGPVLVTALLVGAATTVGFILCYLPGLIVAFLTSYSLYFVLDKNLAPVDAIRASFELVRDNLGNALVWYLIGGVIAAVGAFLCLVGAIFTFPLVLIGTAYTYKVFTGQEVAA
ncbi:hypothetical protein [Nocardioides sp. YIM 152588]|uniref:hypothetical protein n=1 Tax=Nocardioides sp. YIM 152588 TaxID=3158259 RepID=UPI0032E3EEEC